jgi:uncharacterized membrane protein
MENNNKQSGTQPHMAEIVERNIASLLEQRKQEEQNKSAQDKIADMITRFAGSMAFVYIHLCLFGMWIIWNLGWLGLPPFDESFVVLAMFASVEAIFLSTFVLISQNRASIQADKRADLDLQVGLLSEHEVTHLITLVRAIAKKMEIEDAYHPELEELAQDIRPENVIETMDRRKTDQ